MKKVSGRAIFPLILAIVLLAGTVLLCVRYFAKADEWVTFSGSPHVYTGVNLDGGASLIFRFTSPTKTVWSMWSKQPLMSPSINHLAPENSCLACANAVWQLRFGRNPCEQFRKTGSYTACSTSRSTSCTSLSVKVGIPSGRIFPLAFWI